MQIKTTVSWVVILKDIFQVLVERVRKEKLHQIHIVID